MKIGDNCRASCTAPARYVGFGKCVYISAQDGSSRILTDAGSPDFSPPRLPRLDDDELATYVRLARMKFGRRAA